MTQQPPQDPSDNKLISADSIENNTSNLSSKAPSLVPIGITIGLALFTLILALAGYGFRLAFGDSWDEVFSHAIIIVPIFVIGIPLGFWLGSLVLNHVMGMNIQTRNALSLGWLTASVAILWLMGAYS